MAAFGDEPLPGTVESRHACFASFSMTALTQASTAEGTVGRPPACVLEPPSPDEAPEFSDASAEGEGPLLCEVEEEDEPPEHAAMSGAAASNVTAAAQPMTLLPDSGRAMTYCSLHARCPPFAARGGYDGQREPNGCTKRYNAGHVGGPRGAFGGASLNTTNAQRDMRPTRLGDRHDALGSPARGPSRRPNTTGPST
ncbi:hypothetical protein SVIO_072510 [Streptomyces violaceusniger]|uniref:Uncharacterized protein n=1 Tax=Streptomyces violaceusniger TaxID=68280 RepID=A0A4D4LDR4_STRVO|nr:hypothetical protein SVIO_072510 [Streptomyces violaceusniger]